MVDGEGNQSLVGVAKTMEISRMLSGVPGRPLRCRR